MILQAKNISKRYGNHLAVDHIHLQFEKGTFNAILGPNGAGKSTTNFHVDWFETTNARRHYL